MTLPHILEQPQQIPIRVRHDELAVAHLVIVASIPFFLERQI
jgi:hypothetical protein